MAESRKIVVSKKSDCGKLSERTVPREALKEVEALECEIGRINKRLAALKQLLKAA